MMRLASLVWLTAGIISVVVMLVAKDWRLDALLVCAWLMILFVRVLVFGGGNPNHKDHTPLDGGKRLW